jgi:hypothetical protein
VKARPIVTQPGSLVYSHSIIRTIHPSWLDRIFLLVLRGRI